MMKMKVMKKKRFEVLGGSKKLYGNLLKNLNKFI